MVWWWGVIVAVLPAALFAAGCAARRDDATPRAWRRPGSYGRLIFLWAALLALAWAATPLWERRDLLGSAEASRRAGVWSEALARVPWSAALLLVGAGVLVASTSWRPGASSALYCRSCGYRHTRGGRRLTPRCPECAAPWNWYGMTRRGDAFRPGRRLGAGLVMSGVGAGLAAVLLVV